MLMTAREETYQKVRTALEELAYEGAAITVKAVAKQAGVLCQKGLPLCRERFAVGPSRDHERLLGALHRS